MDRFVSAPLLVTLAADLGASVAAAALVVSGHLLAYGLGQLPWAVFTQRAGAAVALRTSLFGAALFAAMAAAAPSLAMLVAARAGGGLFLAAAVPAAVLYVAAHLPAGQQTRGFAGIIAANGWGIVFATAVAALGAGTGQWRMGYAAASLLLLVAGLLVRGLGGDHGTFATSASEAGKASATPPARRAIARAPRRVLRPATLVFVEGVAVVGAVVALPVLAQKAALPDAVGLIAIGVYGCSMPIASSVLMRTRTARATLSRRLTLSCLALLVAAAVLWGAPPLLGVLTTAALLGGCWSALHPALQDAAAQAWPTRQAYGLAIFVTALFVGSATGAQAFALVGEIPGRTGTSLAFLVGAGVLLLSERATRRLA